MASRLPATFVISSEATSPAIMVSRCASYTGAVAIAIGVPGHPLLLDQLDDPILAQHGGEDGVAGAPVVEVEAAQVRDGSDHPALDQRQPAMLAGTVTAMVTSPPRLVRKPCAPA